MSDIEVRVLEQNSLLRGDNVQGRPIHGDNKVIYGFYELGEELRRRLRLLSGTPGDSIRHVAARTNISAGYISRFKDGEMVCMNIMNRLACYFEIDYMITNYEDRLDKSIN